jgi:hypothetical protein
MATRREITMLICPLNLEQFGQKVSEKLALFHPRWFERSYETMKAREMNLKQPQNEIKMSLKLTLRSKGDKTKV